MAHFRQPRRCPHNAVHHTGAPARAHTASGVPRTPWRGASVTPKSPKIAACGKDPTHTPCSPVTLGQPQASSQLFNPHNPTLSCGLVHRAVAPISRPGQRPDLRTSQTAKLMRPFAVTSRPNSPTLPVFNHLPALRPPLSPPAAHSNATLVREEPRIHASRQRRESTVLFKN
jgi:hypothetical protein